MNGFRRLYRAALVAAPKKFRRHHGAEMETLVLERVADARRRGGRAAAWRRGAFELADAVRAGVRLRVAQLHAPDTRLPFAGALRATRRRPAFAALSALTLGLGLGIAMAIGGVIDAVLVRPLPYVDSDRLVMVWRTFSRPGIVRGPASYPDYLDWQSATRAFSELAAYGGTTLTYDADGDPERFSGLRVSGNLFRTLGNRPALGRTIIPDDDRATAEPVIVLGDPIWRRRFGADSTIVGRVVTFGERRFRVVGVMPPGFAFPNAGPRFWTALRLDASKTERDANRFTVIGRLAPGADVETARREIAAISARIAGQYPKVNADAGIRLEPRHEAVTGPVRPLLLLLGLTGAVVLAMACVNVANLFLVRGVARAREIAVRRALGASDGSIVREALAECVVLAVASAGVGAAIAMGLMRTLIALGPPVPRASEMAVGGSVLVAGLVVSLAVYALAGLPPSIRSSRRITHSLAGGARGGVSPVARRLYAGFVVVQIAMALTLFVAAGLLSRSFYNLVTVPRGFDGARILTGYLALPPARYGSDERVLSFFQQVVDRLAAVPGVRSSSGTWALPFSDGYASSSIVPADRPVPDAPPPVAVAPVFPGFFHTLGVPLQRGRDFNASDDAGAQAVAIVNETLARRFWPDGDALGKSLRPADPSDGGPIPIVGIVSDMKRRGLALPAEPEVYRPFAQAVYSGDLYVTLRVDGDPKAVIPAFKRVVGELDRSLPLTLVSTLDELVDASIVAPRLRTMLIGAFAALAGLMALVGVYGVLGFVVAQRKHEIALRGALGATSSRVVGEVVAQGLRITLGGVIVGLAGAAGAAFTVRTMVFGVSAFDPLTYAGAIAGLALVAGLGCWIPARRASRVDPMLVLREESAL